MGKGMCTALLAVFVVSGCVRSPTQSGAAELRLQLGMHYLAVEDYPAARRNLLRAQAAAPQGLPRAWHWPGWLSGRGTLPQQHYHFQHAQRIASHNGYIPNNYGAFLCALGQYDEAHQQFIRAGCAGRRRPYRCV
ncbi:hypothetical protein WDV93_15195 [Pantoea ananatis]